MSKLTMSILSVAILALLVSNSDSAVKLIKGATGALAGLIRTATVQGL